MGCSFEVLIAAARLNLGPSARKSYHIYAVLISKSKRETRDA